MSLALGISVAKILLVFAVVMNTVPVLIYLERKICAWVQNRRGPNRVGPFGILQPLADAIKLIFKEDIIPARADRLLFICAPLCCFVPGMIALSVIPFGNALCIPAGWPGAGTTVSLQIADLNVGVLFALTVTSLSIYGITFGGWASNNKWSLLGGIRASAQMISYEAAMGLAVIAVFMMASSVSGRDIVINQTGSLGGWLPAWNVFRQPVAFFIFLMAAFAENNRAPFDLPECEPELIGGYHTEYSSMKFAMFFMGEYVSMIVMSALLVTLFLGGWHLPGLDPADHGPVAALLSMLVFGAKTFAVLLFYIWVRWTVPRFRFDQLMGLGWKGAIPVALVNLLGTAWWGLRA